MADRSSSPQKKVNSPQKKSNSPQKKKISSVECSRCCVETNSFRACSECQQYFCSSCHKLGALKNPCTNGLAHGLLQEGEMLEIAEDPSSPTFISLPLASAPSTSFSSRSDKGHEDESRTLSPSSSSSSSSKNILTKKKSRKFKKKKDIIEKEGGGGGGGGGEESSTDACSNCSETVSGLFLTCSLCGHAYCQSCQKLATMGMVPCSKGKSHRFTQEEGAAGSPMPGEKKRKPPSDLIKMADELRKGLLASKLATPKLRFQSQEAVKWIAANWDLSEVDALKLLQILLQNRFIYPSKYGQSDQYIQVSIGENYFFQQIGEGKSYLDLKDIDWDQLQTDIFGKAGIKVKDRWKNMKKYSNCFLGTEAVDWLCNKFRIIRPVAISMGEEMMTRALFFPVDTNTKMMFLDRPIFYTVIRESNDPSQQKLVVTLQKILNGEQIDPEMRTNVSFILRSLVQSSNNYLNRRVDAMEMIAQSDEVDDLTKLYLGSHLGINTSTTNLKKYNKRPGSPPSSSSSSLHHGYRSPSSTVLGTFVSTSLTEPYFSQTFEKITSWNFEILQLSDDVNGFPMMYIGFCIARYFNWFDKFNLKEETLRNFLLAVESGYRKENSYHNNTHAADVTQTLMYFLTTGGLIEQYELTPLEVLGAIIAAQLHDIDHPGRNNAFLVNTSHPLAILYNDESVLENHHSATVRKMVIGLILATDFAKHFSLVAMFKDLFASEERDMSLPENRLLVLKIALKGADISHTTKAQHLHLAWTDRVSEEFFCQGDEEKKAGLPISPGMNREEVNLCKSQMGFLNFLGLPLYQEFAKHHPGCEVSLKGVQRNLKYWKNRSLCEGV